jgi:hypothetical protein
MSLDEFRAEYRRRSLEGVLALLRGSAEVALDDLRELLAAAPELRRVTLAELFEERLLAPARPPPAPRSAAAKVAGYLLDLATTAGTREGGGLRVTLPSYAEIGDRVGATHDSVALTVAILERRDLITVCQQGVVVRDLPGLALLAERPLAGPRSRHGRPRQGRGRGG